MSNRYVIDDINEAISVRAFPTITMWNRLEGRPRKDDFDRALKAEIRDPLWMLTKQWQMGEFLGDDAGSPLTFSMADTIFHAVAVAGLGATRAAMLSLHSGRVFCACALLAQGAPRSMILALCRWRDERSLDVYARPSAAEYLSWMIKVSVAVVVDSIAPRNMPQLLDYDEAARLATSFLQANPPPEDAVVSRVNRQVSSVERRIEQEDKRLQARMVQISKMRATALKREDSRGLKNVELLEQQAYKEYEARMNRILAELNGDPTKPQSRRRSNTRNRSSSARPQRRSSQKRSVSRRGRAAKGYSR